jgi:hypothetical protein
MPALIQLLAETTEGGPNVVVALVDVIAGWQVILEGGGRGGR